MMTYTDAILEVSPQTYEDIRRRLVAATVAKGAPASATPEIRDSSEAETIDMRGLAIRAVEGRRPVTIKAWRDEWAEDLPGIALAQLDRILLDQERSSDEPEAGP